MSELREMVREILDIAKEVIAGKIKMEEGQNKTDKIIKKMNAWHIRERKKWAKDCVPKEKENFFKGHLLHTKWLEGFSQCRAETLKNIEEAK